MRVWSLLLVERVREGAGFSSHSSERDSPRVKEIIASTSCCLSVGFDDVLGARCTGLSHWLWNTCNRSRIFEG